MEINLARFLPKVDQSAGPEQCWPWQGALNRQGYGIYGTGPHRHAHRVAWKMWVGEPIPPELDHTCRNRACVNPAHLEPVDHAENMRRAALARTGGVCTCGTPREVGHRCRECYNAYMRVYNRMYRARRRAEGRPMSHG